jgi:protein gp37
MMDSRISWCHATFNPWTGCNAVSPGCNPCYADEQLTRQQGRNFNILALTQTWSMPRKLNAIARSTGAEAICFVCSLSDFFHAGADQWRSDVWRIIKECPNVNFMLLTKRPERIVDCLPTDWGEGKNYPGAWLGTSVENADVLGRVDFLRAIPCSLRFLSIEPLMESVGGINLDGIGWVAVGGTSGPKYKEYPMKMNWAAEVHDLCRQHEIPFLFKQAGAYRSESGINALSLYLAEREGRKVDPATVAIFRGYPATHRPLLPFIEHGCRFTAEDWEKNKLAEASAEKSDLIQIGPL